MVEFPQPSADLLPSGLGEISLRRHQKLGSAENPYSVAITHPLAALPLGEMHVEGLGEMLSRGGVHVNTGWGTRRGP